MKLPRLALAGMALTVVAVAGCGNGNGAGDDGGGDDGSGPVTLDFWAPVADEAGKAVTEKLIDEFNNTHETQIKLRVVTTEFRPVIRNAFTSGNPPEIWNQEGYNDLFAYVKEGLVPEITDWWNEPGNGDRFAKAGWPSVTYEDKVYGIPQVNYVTNQIFYNKKILDENGIDPATLKTWDDYLAAFEKLDAAGVTPVVYGNRDGWPGSEWFYNFLAKNVGAKKVLQLAARNCGYKWTDPDVVEAAQLYVDVSDKGYFGEGKASDDWNAANAAFLGGKGAFYYMGNWFFASILAAPNADDFGMNLWPTVPGGAGGEGDLLVSTEGLTLSNSVDTDAKMEGALEFLDWWSAVEQEKLKVEAGSISAVTEANDPALQDPFSSQVAEQLKTATDVFPFVEHITPLPVGEDAIWKGSIGVLTGQLTAQTWMESVEEAAEANPPTLTLEEDCAS